MTERNLLTELADFYAGGQPAAAPAPAPVAVPQIVPGTWQDYESRGILFSAWPEHVADQFLADQESGNFTPPVLPQTDVVALKAKVMSEAGLPVADTRFDMPVSDTQLAGALHQEVSYVEAINALSTDIHQNNIIAGWWTDINTGQTLLGKDEFGRDRRNVGELLCLVHSEVSEAMEGYRKNLMDDKLPHRSMLEVELADTMIRIFDIAGAHGLDLGGAIAEKRAFNAKREDHQIANRMGDNGKKF
jgi:NTP pyrophosphatase (non-canonical NTP hydrolase)